MPLLVGLASASLLFFSVLVIAPSALIAPTATAQTQILSLGTTETIEDTIRRIASREGIKYETLYNLVKSESNFNPLAVGDKGCSYGLVQINTCANPITVEQALDIEWALTFASQNIKKGKEYLWSVCSCVSHVRIHYPNLPRGDADTFSPNTTFAEDFDVLIMEYSGVRHLSAKVKIDPDGVWISEANKVPCLTQKRKILFSSEEWKSNLVGFYKVN